MLTACISGGEADHAPEITHSQLPHVEDGANPPGTELDFTMLDTGAITASLPAVPSEDKGSIYRRLTNIDPKTKKATSDFPIEPSAPLLEVTLGADKKLQYKDTTPGGSPEEQLLLSTVQANDISLRGVMNTGRIHSLHFRIFEPDQYPDSPDLEPNDYMFFLPHDSNDGGQGNIYYYLPANDVVDTRLWT